MIKIDKNVPIPPRKFRGQAFNKQKYPFRDMEPGDSFLLKTLDTKADRHYQRVLMIGCFKNRKHMKNKKIVTRSVPDGIRVWRINDDGSIPENLNSKGEDDGRRN